MKILELIGTLISLISDFFKNKKKESEKVEEIKRAEEVTNDEAKRAAENAQSQDPKKRQEGIDKMRELISD